MEQARESRPAPAAGIRAGPWGNRRCTPADAGIAVLLGLAAGVLYAVTWQPSWYGDGVWILRVAAGHPANVQHPLLATLAILLQGLLPVLGPIEALRAVVLGSAGVGLGATFLLARTLGAGRAAAGGATLLAAACPALWSFATVVEVHAPHFACVALASLATVSVGAAPPGRRLWPWIALALTAPLVVPSHASAKLLVPGFAALAAAARGRAALSPAAGTAALVLSGEVLSYALCQWLGGTAGDEAAAVVFFKSLGQSVGTVLLWGWLVPLGVLGPATIAAALVEARRRPILALAFALFLVPEVAFFSWWGWGEFGGYALAVLPVATAATALLLRTRAALAAAILAVALHADLAWRWGLVSRDAWRVEDRLEAVDRALPAGGTLYSLQFRAPPIGFGRPAVEERSLAKLLSAAHAAGIPPREFGTRFFEAVGAGTYAFDHSSITDPWFRGRGCEPYLESLARAFEDRPDSRRVEVGDWVMTVSDVPPPAGRH